jgi:hypothetical protein
MLKPMILTCTFALGAGEPLDLATYPGHTLPAEAYHLLVKGRDRDSMSWAWKAPGVQIEDGFSVEESRWNWDQRNGTLFRYLREQLDLESRPESPNRLSVRVVYFTVNSAGPQLILEGLLKRGYQPVGYFVDSILLDPGDAATGLVDEFQRDFAAFVR